MAFTPRTLDGLAAGARFMKLTGVKKGTCLNTVFRAFGSPKSDGKYNGYPWASDALKGAIAAGALRRGSIASAPPGAVLYWSNVNGNYNRNGRKVYGDAGHVGIKGHGGFWTIDATGHGSLDFVANDALAKKWPWVKFEGYAYGPGAFLGHTVTTSSSAGNGSTPFNNSKGFLMALTDQQQTEVYDFVKNIAGFVYAGGKDAPNYPGMPGTILQRLRAVQDVVSTPVHRTVDGEVVKIAQIQDNADTNTMVRELLGKPAATVDLDALAAKIVAGLPSGDGKPLTAADVADELVKRLAA